MDSWPSSFISVYTPTSEPASSVRRCVVVHALGHRGWVAHRGRPVEGQLDRDCSVPRVMRSPSRPTKKGERAGHRDRAEPTPSALRFAAPGKRNAGLAR
jgi:hypothetical protein